jgi:hypothetical protein
MESVHTCLLLLFYLSSSLSLPASVGGGGSSQAHLLWGSGFLRVGTEYHCACQEMQAEMHRKGPNEDEEPGPRGSKYPENQ